MKILFERKFNFFPKFDSHVNCTLHFQYKSNFMHTKKMHLVNCTNGNGKDLNTNETMATTTIVLVECISLYSSC